MVTCLWLWIREGPRLNNLVARSPNAKGIFAALCLVLGQHTSLQRNVHMFEKYYRLNQSLKTQLQMFVSKF